MDGRWIRWSFHDYPNITSPMMIFMTPKGKFEKVDGSMKLSCNVIMVDFIGFP